MSRGAASKTGAAASGERKAREAQHSLFALRELEPRIAFDAALGATIDGAVNETDTAAEPAVEPESQIDQADANSDLFDALLGAPDAGNATKEIAFIDSGVENIDALIEAIDPAVEIVVLDPSSDGVEQIADILEDRSDIDAIHIISHGSEGAIVLGDVILTEESMNGEHAEDLALIGSALSSNADILIYGCNFGEGDIGRAAALQLSALTDADIASSNDITGHTLLGGDWELEEHVGVIDASAIVTADSAGNWTNVLASVSLTATQDTWLDKDNDKDNYGASSSLTLDSDGGDEGDGRIIVLFDLSSIPVGATITGATLELDAYSSTGSIAIDVYRLTQAWDEGAQTGGVEDQASWKERQNGVSWTSDGGAFNATAIDTITTGLTGIHAWDVTSTVSDWYTGTHANHGLIVASPDSANHAFQYYSREGAGAAPRLIVTYSLPGDPTITSDGGGYTAAVNAVENQTAVTTVTATDPDIGDTLTFSISGGTDASLFSINASTGELTFNTAPDFETPADANGDNIYEVTVDVTDSTLGSDSQRISVTVTDEASSGAAVWNDNNATPETADWDGSTFGATGNTATLPDKYRIIQGADAPTRTEKIVVGIDSNSNVTGQIWDGTTWTALSLNNLGNVSETYWWGVDVAYEQVSGDAIIVWNDDNQIAGQKLNYAIWDGTSWTTPQHISAYLGAEPQHMSLVFDPGSDSMALVVNDSNADDYVLIWDGDSWGNALLLDSSGTAESDQTAISVAFEAQTGNALVTYGKNSDSSIYYRIFDGSSWGSESSIAAPSGGTSEARWITLASDYNSDRIVMGVTTAGFDAWLTVWDGTSWESPTLAETLITGTTFPNLAVAFESDSGDALATYGHDSDKVLYYRTWSAGGGWSAEFTGPTINDVPHSMTLDRAPLDDGIMLSVLQKNKDLAYIFWNGFSWGTVNELSSDTNEDKNQPFVFIYDQDGALSNRAPTITSDGGGAAATINAAENQTAVTTVTATDLDAGDTLTYSISGGADAGFFSINSSTGVLTFNAAPDFETLADADTDGVYEVTVQVSDGNGGIDTQAISVTVTDVNEAPVITSDGGGANAAVNAAENQTAVTTVTAADVDAGDTLSYSIIGGADAGFFSINSSTGVLAFNAAPDFETLADADTDGVYEVTVQVSDGNGGVDTQSISVTVTDVNEAPVITSDGGGANAAVNAAENQTAVTTVTATDVDAGDTLTYSISGGADAGFFSINSSTGVLTFNAAPNFETLADADTDGVYEVTVQVSDGNGGVDTQAISVTVTDVNEAPVITSDGGGANAAINAAENQTAVTTVTATDEDAGDTLTYSISGGVDAGFFSINSSTGVLTFDAAPDFETMADADTDGVYEVTVQVSDGNGGVDTQAISVTITDANEAPVITSDGGDANAAINAAENQTTVTTVTATDVDAGDTLTYSISGGADAGFFSINASTGVLTFNAAPDFETLADADTDGVYEVTVQVSDGNGGIDTQAISVTVTDVNEAPVITSDGGGVNAAVNAAENQTAVTSVTATDVDAGDTLSFSISGGADAGFFSINSSTGVLTFNAAPDFETLADADTDGVYEVTIQVSDGNGGIDTQAISVTVTDANEAPVITSNGGGANAAMNAAENQTAVTTVTATDVDAGDTLTYSISGGADAGFFSINSSTGVLTFNAAPDFETLADADTDGVYEVTVQVSDGNGGVDTQAISVTVTDVNEAPVITSDGGGANAAINAAENQTAVTTVTSTDEDAGDTLTYSISGGADSGFFSINSSTGVLTFNAAPDFETLADADTDGVYEVTVQVSDGNGGVDTQAISVTVTDANEAPVIISDGGGAAAAINAAENQTAVTTVTATDVDAGDTLTYSISGGADAGFFSINASTGVLTFNAAPDFETLADADTNGVYEVTVQVSDGNGGVDTQAISVTVTDVNEAPVITSDGGGTNAAVNAAENQTAVTTVTATDEDAGDTLTYSISGGADAGFFSINASTGVLTFNAAPDFESLADADTDGVYEVTVQVSDGNGGVDTQAISVTVTDANEAPVITSDGGGANAAMNAAENQTAVTTVTATDVDAGDTLTYSISGGADAGFFSINASTGVLTFNAAPDFETLADANSDGAYEVTVQVSDGNGGVDTQVISVTVTDVNEAPVITSDGGGANAAINAAENQTAVTTVTATDEDAGDTLTYSISGGADAGFFSINSSTGVLTFNAAPDFETMADADTDGVYEVTVQVSDGNGGVDTQAISVTVTDANEAPVITSDGGGANAAVNAAENQTAVTTVAATDVDAGDTLTYSISGGADAGFFSINSSTGVLTFNAAPDFETLADADTDGVYEVTVQVSDGNGGVDTQAISVTVTDANEAPIITSDGGGANAAVNAAENQTAVTTVTATDVDAGDTLTYTISGGADAGFFSINASTGVLTFNAAPDFETLADADTDGVYEVTVQVSDGNGGVDTQAISVTVTDANEAPVITSDGGGANAAVNAAENQTAVTTVAATDVDAGDTLTYSISGGADAGFFSINSSTGVLTFNAAPDFETLADANSDGVYEVTVQVSDGNGGVDTQAISVTVTDVNEAPVITSDGGGANAAVNAAENQTAVTTVTATDVDAGDTPTYSISGGADAGFFSINASTGVLTFNAAPDFETLADANSDGAYEVTVQVSDGNGGVDTQAISVTVTDVNEAPVITSDGGGANAAINAAENQTAVTTVTATDVDVGDTLTYSISGGADAGFFSINASTGVLTFNAAPDFETLADADTDGVYEVTVQVSDGNGGVDTQAISVTVTDVNEAPVITSDGGGANAAVNAAENQTAVTTVTATDVDAGDTLTYSISGGADAGFFSINASTGVLTFNAAPDFEAMADGDTDGVYEVTVQVSDGNGGIDTQAISVTVTDANEAPVITSDGGGANAAINAAENQTAVTTVTATDVDVGDTLTYSISGGADAGFFSINASTGVLTFNAAPDFESLADADTDGVYEVTVQVSDGNGGVDTQAISVTVTDANEAPVITSDGGGANAAVNAAENQTAVTTVTATDEDAGDTLTYSINGGADAGFFSINASTGVLTFNAAPDFEAMADADTDGVYEVTVQVSDGNGGIDTQAISVTVTDANEAPVITSDGGGANAAINAAENQTAVTTVTATDVDVGDTLTYSISGGADAGFFSINASTGVLTFNAASDFETLADADTDGVYEVTVQVSDGNGGIDTQAISVSVTNLNDAPTITSDGGGASATINATENQTAVTTVTAADDDVGDTVTYTINGGADAGRFAIDAATGVLSFIAAPDFESPNDNDLNGVYEVVVEAFDGVGGVDTQAISVSVTSVNEAPAITSDGGGANAAVNATENQNAVTTITATDVDAGDTLTYSITGGADAGLFTIDAVSGALIMNPAPDFEIPTDANADGAYEVTVQVDDGNGGVDTQVIIVTVTDIMDDPVAPPVDPPAVEPPSQQPPPEVETPDPIDADPTSDDETEIDEDLEQAISSQPPVDENLEETQSSDRKSGANDNENVAEKIVRVIESVGEGARTINYNIGLPTTLRVELSQFESTGIQFSAFSKTNFNSALDLMKTEMEQSGNFVGTTAGQITIGTGLSLTAGLAAWVQRGSSLVSAFLTTMPAWQRLDPLVIFLTPRDDKKNNEQTSKVDQMFDKAERQPGQKGGKS